MFTGRFHDEESGLEYYRARSYSTVTGRFLQRDPIGVQSGANLYAAVRMSPMNNLDPLGLVDYPSGVRALQGEEKAAMYKVLDSHGHGGVLDFVTFLAISQDAIATTRHTGSKSEVEYPTDNSWGWRDAADDAMRHCFWMCQIARRFGEDAASEIGEVHEDYGIREAIAAEKSAHDSYAALLTLHDRDGRMLFEGEVG